MNRVIPVLLLIGYGVVIGLLIFGVAGVSYGQSYLTPVYPGTRAQDYSQPQYRVQGDRVFQVHPGTRAQDYSGREYRIDGDSLYEVHPGTSAQDYFGSESLWD